MAGDNKFHVSGNAADSYERNMVRGVFSVWAANLVEIAAIAPGEKILDIACGTGVVARRAAEATGPSGAVTGLELNKAMLDVARNLAPSGGAAMEWVEGNAENMALPDGAFDVALC